MQLTPANYAAETWATGSSYLTYVGNFNGKVIGVHDSNPSDHYAYVMTNHSYTCGVLYGTLQRQMHRNMHWFL
jgi:hypothetical protein